MSPWGWGDSPDAEGNRSCQGEDDRSCTLGYANRRNFIFTSYLREKLSPDPGRHDFIAPQPGVTLAYRRDGDCPGWEATIKTFEELYDAADWAGIEYIYIYDTNGQWLYLPTGNQEAVLRSLKEDLENDTVQYSEPPDLEDLLGEDWDEEQEDGPSIEM